MSKKQKQHQAIIPGHATAVKLAGTSREDFAHAMKFFKRKVKSSGVLEKIKDNKTFIKPSAKRRKELSAARYIQYVRDLHRD
jgi:small subunit ribosomal protein S21